MRLTSTAMSNNSLSPSFSLESGVNIPPPPFFHRPFNWIGEVWMDGTHAGPVCGCWFVSFPTPACNRPLPTPWRRLRPVIVLIHLVYQRCDGERHRRAWKPGQVCGVSVTLLAVTFSLFQKKYIVTGELFVFALAVKLCLFTFAPLFCELLRDVFEKKQLLFVCV